MNTTKIVLVIAGIVLMLALVSIVQDTTFYVYSKGTGGLIGRFNTTEWKVSNQCDDKGVLLVIDKSDGDTAVFACDTVSIYRGRLN